MRCRWGYWTDSIVIEIKVVTFYVVIYEVVLLVQDLCLYSKSSLTPKEWRFNLSFPRVSMLGVVPYYVSTHPPSIQ
jgi:hypothetical protein